MEERGARVRKTTRDLTRQAWFRWTEAVLWFLVVAALAYRFLPAATPPVLGEGLEAPGFSVRTLAGERFRLSDHRGEVVLVNFWATWCPPCRMEMPGFQRVYDAYKELGFTVVGLSADVGAGAERAVADFIAANGITYPVAMATPEIQQEYGGVSSLPQSFLLDREGRLRRRVTGIFDEFRLESAVKDLLAEEGNR
ncbi:MAG: TlpA family protein disulfide reductase [Gemmatimonadota bacterium]